MSSHMHLTYPSRSFVDPPVDRCRYGQRPTDYCADTRQEAREGFRTRLAIDDLHGGDVIRYENAGYAASEDRALLGVMSIQHRGILQGESPTLRVIFLCDLPRSRYRR